MSASKATRFQKRSGQGPGDEYSRYVVEVEMASSEEVGKRGVTIVKIVLVPWSKHRCRVGFGSVGRGRTESEADGRSVADRHEASGCWM